MSLKQFKTISLNRPRLFIAKLLALLAFSVAYLPLAELKSSTPFAVYLSALVVVHVFFFGVLFYEVRASTFNSRKSLATRILVVIALIGALMALGRSPVRAEIATFLTLSFALHVALVSTLHIKISHSRTAVTPVKKSQRYPQKIA